MISGEYDAAQAYQSFNTQLLEEEATSENIVLDSQKSYSNRFHSSGGNAAYSVMANTLRSIYGSDVLIATGNSFTGNVLKAGYTEKQAGNMIMPNSLSAYSSKMSGAELKETVRNFVEGYQGGFIPFNRGSLPVVSGISVEIKETEDGYILKKVKKDGKTVQDKDTFTVTCLAIPKHMEAYPADDTVVFDGADTTVKNTWTEYVSDGDAVLAEPERLYNSEVRRMDSKKHNAKRKKRVVRKRVRIAVFIVFFIGIILSVFQYFRFDVEKRFMKKVFLI